MNPVRTTFSTSQPSSLSRVQNESDILFKNENSVSIILAIAVLIGAIGQLIKVLVPVMINGKK